MTDILEKAARAIVQVGEQNGGPSWEHLESDAGMKKHVLPMKRDEAKAVASLLLGEMMEPDQFMRAAGQWTISDNTTISVCLKHNKLAEDVWQAMLNKFSAVHNIPLPETDE